MKADISNIKLVQERDLKGEPEVLIQVIGIDPSWQKGQSFTGHGFPKYRAHVKAQINYTKSGNAFARVSILEAPSHEDGHLFDQNVFATVATGKATGGGYHKESAAVAQALDKLGITFDHEIGGVGRLQVCKALQAVADAIGWKQTDIVVTGL